MTLRLAILLIGALLVVGIYLWGASNRRRGRHLTYDPHLARIESINGPRRAPQAVAETAADRGEAPRIGRFPADDHDELATLPRITVDRCEKPPAASAKDAQLEMRFDDHAVGSAPAGGSEQRQRAAGAPPDLLTLYVRARSGGVFSGRSLVAALNAVGLRFGELQIFHHFGAGELRAEKPVFSAANMLEPGTFNLDRIEFMQTGGVVLFMQLPTSLDGPVAFELFLNTAQRVAEALSGELYSEPERKLDKTAIDRMRRIAGAHGDGGV